MKTKLFLFLTLLLLAFTVKAQSINALFHQANDPIAGNPKGSITVVEFFDYQCSHCINMAPTISAIIKANPNVRVVFKEFPIRGPMSEFASRVALAANKQGKYDAFQHALLTANQPLSEDAVFNIAKNVGLNVNKLKKEMNSKSINNQINANMRLAQELNVPGTPVFFIGKTNAKSDNDIGYAAGELSQSELQDAIDKAGK